MVDQPAGRPVSKRSDGTLIREFYIVEGGAKAPTEALIRVRMTL